METNTQQSGAAPPVAVGLPVYNGEGIVERAIRTLLDQSYADFELILSDNASTDRTEEICREFAASDERIRYVRQPTNIGVTNNFNAVYRMARSPFFKWAAADDYCGPDLLRLCLDALQSDRGREAVGAYTKTTLIDERGDPIAFEDRSVDFAYPDVRRRFELALEPEQLHQNTVYGLFRSEAITRTRNIGGYMAADRVFNAEILLYGPMMELPERQLYRMVKPTNYGTNPDSVEAFTPGASHLWVFPEWRVLREHLQSIARAPLPFATKAALLRALLARMARERSAYRYEITRVVRRLLRRSPPSGGHGPAQEE